MSDEPNGASRSLALIEGNELLGFGGQDAVDRLRNALARVKPLELEHLTVEAAAGSVHVEGTWVLSRPSFRFGLTEPVG